MARLPRVTATEIIRALERAGWYEVRRSGSHRQFHHAQRPGTVTVALHGGRTVRLRELANILRQAGMRPDEFIALL
jgi:predicted RNA binding protein YcfA (HicA-like mRNA interferase family)